MVKTRKFILAKHFVGEPKASDFKLVEEDLPPLKDGEILCEAVWLSVDFYMRAYEENLPTGTTMIGTQVAKVLESKHPHYKVGVHVVGHFGWQTKSVVNINNLPKGNWNGTPYIVREYPGVPLSYALGVLGMPGNTAYFGFLEICKPKPGDILVISGAAGAVGSHVGQIAKVKGCKVIGFAGSDDKVKWLKNELKFDAAFNYKKIDVSEALKQAAPDGIDCYFDTVGGEMSTAVIVQMKYHGRIAVCGSNCPHNDITRLPKAAVVQPSFVISQLKMEGFLVSQWDDRWHEGIDYNAKLIKEGKLVCQETVTEGFESMFKAFLGVLRSETVGKAVVKA